MYLLLGLAGMGLPFQTGINALVNVPPPIEAEASCFSENSTTNSKELWRLTLSPQA